MIFRQRYPNWPEPSSVKCLRWRYSQVHQPYENCPKAIILNENPLLIAGGDGFMPKSGFDTCLDSASAITDILNDKLWLLTLDYLLTYLSKGSLSLPYLVTLFFHVMKYINVNKIWKTDISIYKNKTELKYLIEIGRKKCHCPPNHCQKY